MGPLLDVSRRLSLVAGLHMICLLAKYLSVSPCVGRIAYTQLLHAHHSTVLVRTEVDRHDNCHHTCLCCMLDP